MNIKKNLIAAAALALVLSVVNSPVSADSVAINFEQTTYSVGNINNQDGWSKSGPYDVGVVSNSFGFTTFGLQTLRISNAITSGSFGDQTFSKSLVNEAGETDAQNSTYSGGERERLFEAQFDIAAAKPEFQPGLFMSVSPDRGDGARMSYIGFEDTVDGINVLFYDYQDISPYGTLATPEEGCSGGDNWILANIVTLDRATPHTIKLTMDLVDGPRNDIVKVYVDGVLEHTGTSWEDYFRWCTESGGGVPNDANANVSRTVDSLLFRVGGASAPDTSGFGYLVDNLALQSGVQLITPTSKESCKKNGWMTFNNPTFKNQGDCVSFVQSNANAVGNKSK